MACSATRFPRCIVSTVQHGGSPLAVALAVGDLALNVAMDASMVVGAGEGLRAAYIGLHAAEDVGEHLAVEGVAHAAEGAAEHEAEDAVAHEAEQATASALESGGGDEALFRRGVDQAKAAGESLDDETRLQRALMSKEDQAYQTADKFGINLRGQKLVYAPDEFGMGQLAKVAKADPWTIKLGSEAFTDERTLANPMCTFGG